MWGTQISMRGFVTNRDTQQIGTTIDGLPNGGSGYGGGSLANRYIDTLDLETVEVSQGTADISSRSNEALGGTLNFLTSDPLQEQR
ncbi:TonB-dependent receptor plug domain-containing protein, partial [Variovorax sp. 2RAF20]